MRQTSAPSKAPQPARDIVSSLSLSGQSGRYRYDTYRYHALRLTQTHTDSRTVPVWCRRWKSRAMTIGVLTAIDDGLTTGRQRGREAEKQRGRKRQRETERERETQRDNQR